MGYNKNVVKLDKAIGGKYCNYSTRHINNARLSLYTALVA